MKAARLVVLTVAIAAGGVAAMLAARTGTHPKSKTPAGQKSAGVEVLVAKSDIPVGSKISQGDVTWQAWPAGANTGNFIRRKQHPTAIKGMSGWIVRSAFVAGEPIRRQKLVQANGAGYMAAVLPPGMRAVSIGVSARSGASGFILPNDRVDVVLTREDRQDRQVGQNYVTNTILRDVRVLAIGQNVAEKNGKKVVMGNTATLELTPRQVETIELSSREGKLSLALRSIADFGKKTPEGESDDSTARYAVNVVRFGVTTTTPSR